MTHPKAHEQPRGGSTLVKGDSVERSGGTVGPGDPGYDELVAKTPVENVKEPGTFNRAASHRDLEEQPKPPARREVAQRAQAESSTQKGEK